MNFNRNKQASQIGRFGADLKHQVMHPIDDTLGRMSNTWEGIKHPIAAMKDSRLLSGQEMSDERKARNAAKAAPAAPAAAPAAGAKTAGAMSEHEQMLFENVYLPAFAEKCAAAGIDLSDPATLSDALDTTMLVKQMTQATGNNIVKSAAAELKSALGIHEQEAEESWHTSAKQAAASLASNISIQQALIGAISQ